MKRSVVALVLTAVMLSGCTSAPKGNENAGEVKNNAVTEENSSDKFSVRDGIFLGYIDTDAMYYDTGILRSYIANGKGELIVPVSETDKSIIEYDGKQYAVEDSISNVEKITEEGYDYEYYSYDNTYVIYDENGKEVCRIEDVAFANYLSDGNFYVCLGNEEGYALINPFTGRNEKTGPCDIIYNYITRENLGLIRMDESWNVQGISDINGDNYFELEGYNYGYGVPTKYTSFIAMKKDVAPDSDFAENVGYEVTDLANLYDLKGNRLSDIDFIGINSTDEYVLCYDGNETHVFDGKDGKELYTINGNVEYLFDNGNYVELSGYDENRKQTHTVMSGNGEVLSGGWANFNYYNNESKDKFVFGKEIRNYVYENYILDTDGNTLCGPIGGEESWIVAVADNYFIVENYDSNNYTTSYNIYDYSGNEKNADKKYSRFSYYYNPETEYTYYIMAYKNPISSSSYVYDILDSDMNVISTGFKGVNFFNQNKNDCVVSVEKGFDIGIYDFKTDEWIFKQSAFNILED